jgi:hypothetical protein
MLRFCFSLALLAFMGTAAQANPLPVFPGPGENPTSYKFYATGGDVVAYYAGTIAGFDDSIGLLVNGMEVGGLVFDNKDPATDPGAQADFGYVAPGAELVFFINVVDSDQGNTYKYYSDASLNAGNINYVYSTYTVSGGPWNQKSGLYIGFDDLSPINDAFLGAAFSYNHYEDMGIIVTGVGAVPELSTWSMLLIGFAGLGLAGYRRTLKSAATLTVA